MQKLLTTDQVPDGLLSALASREVVLWLRQTPQDTDAETLANFIGLPWREVLLGEDSPELLQSIEQNPLPDLVHRRGYLQLVDRDPSLISLPPRSLPIYLLADKAGESEFDGLVRRHRRL